MSPLDILLLAAVALGCGVLGAITARFALPRLYIRYLEWRGAA